MKNTYTNRDPYDTAVPLPGGEVEGRAIPDRGQAPNRGGYGANQAALNRGHLKCDQPEIYEDPHPQRGPLFGGQMEGGFLRRTVLSDER